MAKSLFYEIANGITIIFGTGIYICFYPNSFR